MARALLPARTQAAHVAARLAHAQALGVGGDSWEAAHADGTTATLTSLSVVPAMNRPVNIRLPNIAVPSEQSWGQWTLYAASGTDVRVQTVIRSGDRSLIVLDVQTSAGYVQAALRDLSFFHLGDIWRGSYDASSGTWIRRTLKYANVPLSVVPGGQVDVTDMATGAVGARETFTGSTPLTTEIRENDQVRNVRWASGLLYLADTRFVVSTVAIFPSIIVLRYQKETT